MAGEPRRFFIDPGLLGQSQVTLKGDLAHRLSKVLRYRPGDEIILTSGGPKEYHVRLDNVGPKAVSGEVLSEPDAPSEPRVTLILYQALIRASRFDFAIEKGTEAGVARFVPVVCSRTQGHNDEASAKRPERWRRIVVEAAEQCGRGKLPEITEPISFEDAVRSAPGLKVVAWEGERDLKLASYLRSAPESPDTLSLFIGPEGGFIDEEIATAKVADAVLVTLGQRVLRSETAAVIACGIALHELE